MPTSAADGGEGTREEAKAQSPIVGRGEGRPERRLLRGNPARHCPASTLGLCVCFVAKSCLVLCDPVDCSPPGSSVHGVSRQESWSGLLFPSPEETEPGSPASQGDSSRLSHLSSPSSQWLPVSFLQRLQKMTQ